MTSGSNSAAMSFAGVRLKIFRDMNISQDGPWSLAS